MIIANAILILTTILSFLDKYFFHILSSWASELKYGILFGTINSDYEPFSKIIETISKNEQWITIVGIILLVIINAIYIAKKKRKSN